MNEHPTSRAIESFVRTFGRTPELVVRAPGRVNLIGDHVDYAGGLVMPIAIELHASVAISRNQDDRRQVSTFHSTDLDRSVEIDLRDPVEARPASEPSSFINYISGPIEQLRTSGLEIPQMDLVIASSIPMGGGLSSSAALEVGTILAIRTLLGSPATPLEIALEAQRAEHLQAGTPCGIMDMYVSAAAAAGSACLIDCATNQLRQIPMPREEDAVVLITDTRTRHALSDGAYASRRRDCEEAARLIGVGLLAEASLEQLDATPLPDVVGCRARHVIEETARVRRFAAALEAQDLTAAGELMFESHRSLDTLFEVSCPELNLLVETALELREHGLHGSRMTGGGFGGCTVSLCRPEALDFVMKTLASRFESTFGHAPVFHVSRAAQGASVEPRRE